MGTYSTDYRERLSNVRTFSPQKGETKPNMRVHLKIVLNIAMFFIMIIGVFTKNANCDEQQVIREGYNMVEAAPGVILPHESKVFSFGAGTFALTPPENYLFKELEPSFGGKVFTFIGPQDAEERKSSVIITVTASDPNKPPESPLMIIAAMIAPFEKRLANYLRRDKQLFYSNGLSFQGASFSGQLLDVPTFGTVLVTQKNNVVYIFQGICPRKAEADKFDVVFTDLVKSFQVTH